MGSQGFVYRLQIDFGHGGAYAHTLADVTTRMMDGSLNVGFTDPFGEVAPPSRLTVKLNNNDGLLKPENTLSPYYGLLTKGTLVRFTTTYLGTTKTEWVGKIDDITPYVHPYADPDQNHYVSITAVDPMPQLLDAQIYPALQTNVTINDAIGAIIDDSASSIVYPYTSSWAVVGVSLVGTARVLSQDIYTASTSTTTLEYFGDNSHDRDNSASARTAIAELMQAELGGRFFWNGTKFEFQHRYFAIENAAATPVLDLLSTDIVSASYVTAKDIVNSVTVTYQPRSLGTAGTVIYSSERSTLISAGQTRSVTCHYRDPNTQNARIGAFDVLDLVSVTDFIANSIADGSGTTLTSFIVASVKPKAQSAVVTVYNSGVSDAWLTTLQIRGTPLYTYERESVSAVDAQSIYDYDRRPRSYSFKLVGDEATAQGYANIVVARFKDQIARFPTVTVYPNTVKLLTANVTIGQTMTIVENVSTKHDREYSVTGIKQGWDMSAAVVHRTTYTLSPIAREQFWILGVAGYSELDTTAVIAV